MANSIFTVGGTVAAGSSLYLSRKVDEELLDLCRAGDFAYILAPRQTGKSSLMISISQQLENEGVHPVIIDLTQLGTQLTAEAWYLGLLAIIEDQLLLETDAVSWWKAHAELGITQRLTGFFQEVLIKEVDGPVVIFIDEIDTTLSLTFTDDFFASIRYFYQARVRLPDFKKLSFVLIGVATPGDLIRDPARTPFNIGHRLDMTDFTLQEALPIAQGLNLPPETARQVLEWVLDWTGGHPYLTQRLCKIITEQNQKYSWSKTEIDELVINTFLGERSEQDNNLQFVRDMLTKRAINPEEVLLTYRDIRVGKQTVLDQEQSLVKSHLKLAGVVKRKGQTLQVRNAIYRTVFDEKWIREHLPVNWAKRLKQALGVIAASLALALIMGGLALYAFVQQGEAQNQRNIANQRATEAEQQARISKVRELAATSVSLQDNDSELALLLAREAVKLSYDRGEPVVPEAKTALHQALEHTFPLATISVHQEKPFDAIFSPDGRTIVTPSGFYTTKFWNWDGKQATEITTLTENNLAPRKASFSPDGKSIITIDDTQGTIWAWDGKTLVQKDVIGNTGQKANAVFSPDGRFILTAGYPSGNAEVFSWDGNSARLLTIVTAPPNHNFGTSLQANFSPDGRYIITANLLNTATIWSWDGKTAEFKTTLEGHSGRVNSAVFSPDGQFILTASHDNTAKLWAWDGEKAKLLRTLSGHSGYVWQANFSRDGRFIVTASEDATAKVWSWDGNTANPVTTLVGHTTALLSAYFSPDDQTILTSSTDLTIKLWPWKGNAPGELAVMSVPYNQDSATAGAIFSPDGRYVLSTNHEGQLRIWGWNGKTPTELLALQTHNQQSVNARFSPDSKKFITFGVDDSVRLWSWDGKVAGEIASENFRTYGFEFLTAGFNLNKPYIAYSNEAGLDILEFDDEQFEFVKKATIPNSADPISRVNFSPDGKYLVTLTQNSILKVWNWDGQKPLELASVKAFAENNNGVSFSPDGHSIIAIAGKEKIAKIFNWDGKSLTERATLKGPSDVNSFLNYVQVGRPTMGSPSDVISSVNFSPDGKRIVSVGRDQLIRVWSWDGTKATEVETIRSSSPLVSALFSPDSNTILAADTSGNVRVYYTSIEDLLAVAQSRLTRELTAEERVQYGLSAR